MNLSDLLTQAWNMSETDHSMRLGRRKLTTLQTGEHFLAPCHRMVYFNSCDAQPQLVYLNHELVKILILPMDHFANRTYHEYLQPSPTFKLFSMYYKCLSYDFSWSKLNNLILHIHPNFLKFLFSSHEVDSFNQLCIK